MSTNVQRNDLFDYQNRYIYQEKEGFKFSLDSILLAEFVKIKKGSYHILDMCTGNAPVPLIISTKTTNPIVGFEIQKEIAKLANLSIKENKLEKQITIVNDDVNEALKLFPGKYFEVITCNPPYFFYDNKRDQNKNDLKTIARHEVKINLSKIFKIVNVLLTDTGDFYLVHRPERLDEIILIATENKLKLKELQLITTKNNLIKIALLRFTKKGNRGIKVRKMIDISKYKSYQNIFEEV